MTKEKTIKLESINKMLDVLKESPLCGNQWGSIYDVLVKIKTEIEETEY
jgi:hypothetical protein